MAEYKNYKDKERRKIYQKIYMRRLYNSKLDNKLKSVLELTEQEIKEVRKNGK